MSAVPWRQPLLCTSRVSLDRATQLLFAMRYVLISIQRCAAGLAFLVAPSPRTCYLQSAHCLSAELTDCKIGFQCTACQCYCWATCRIAVLCTRWSDRIRCLSESKVRTLNRFMLYLRHDVAC